MMRVLFLVCVLLSASNVWAHPAVGDRAKSRVTVTTPGATTQEFYRTFEILAQNPADGRFLVKTTDENGERSEWIAADVFESAEQIDQIMKDCCDIGGMKTKITVAAGTFEACRFHHRDREQNNYFWAGKVPFGALRLDAKWKANGEREISELVEFTNGR